MIQSDYVPIIKIIDKNGIGIEGKLPQVQILYAENLTEINIKDFSLFLNVTQLPTNNFGVVKLIFDYSF